MRRRFQGGRRFGRRRAAWEYSESAAISYVDNVPSPRAPVGVWLFPPGRTDYLCTTRKRDSLTTSTLHLWLDFRWRTVPRQAALAMQQIPDVDMWIRKAESDTTTGNPEPYDQFESPFATPVNPSLITDWSQGVEEDGLESFMWVHHMKGSTPPNANVVNFPVGGPGQARGWANQTDQIEVGDSQNGDAACYVCRKFSVAAEWQPDVMVRSRRRLQRAEGIAFFMTTYGSNTGVTVDIDMNWRYLVS